jgi:hypothetical protein
MYRVRIWLAIVQVQWGSNPVRTSPARWIWLPSRSHSSCSHARVPSTPRLALNRAVITDNLSGLLFRLFISFALHCWIWLLSPDVVLLLLLLLVSLSLSTSCCLLSVPHLDWIWLILFLSLCVSSFLSITTGSGYCLPPAPCTTALLLDLALVS